MARDVITVQCPVLETTQSVASTAVTKTAVDVTNGISIRNALKNKNNSLVLCVENTDDTDAVVTFVAGDTYPNSMLGDLEVTVAADSTTVLQLQDISRFENKDGSVNVDFSSSFTGDIYAVAKSVELNA